MNHPLRLISIACPDKECAVRLAKLSVGHHLAACAQIVGEIESYYWWEGEMENSAEALLLLKTSQDKVEALEKLIKENHPYEVPEFLSLTVDHATPAYRDWMLRELRA